MTKAVSLQKQHHMMINPFVYYLEAVIQAKSPTRGCQLH